MESKRQKKRYKCDKCPWEFKTRGELKAHNSNLHSELRPFQCEHCDYSAKLKSTLQKHLATHFPQTYKTQSCPECPNKYGSRWELLRHLRVHTKEKPYACKMCSFRAATHSVLTAHTRSHTGEKPYKCSLCTSSFSQLSNLKHHKLFVHSKNKVCLIPCSIPGCGRKFKEKRILKQHVESFHNQERNFSCPHCQKEFYGKRDCVRHIQQHHTSERPYKCSVCEYSSSHSSHVTLHERTTHGEYMALECPVCHRKYKNESSLARHQYDAHKERSKTAAPKWNCKEPGCNKEYKSRRGLSEHVKSFHLQQRQFKCLYCDYRANTSGILNTHLKRHLKEKTYGCNICKGWFISSSVLSTHKATAHSELRPFQCDQCNYSAKLNCHLRRHQKRHENMATTFECNICKDSQCSLKPRDYTFPSKNRFNVHMRNTHLNKGSSSSLLTPSGSKGVAVPKTGLRCIKVIHTSRDCTPCFVRLVKIKELKRDPLCKTPITIYA